MSKSMRMTLALAVSLLVVGGCDLVTAPTPLEEFTWIAVDNPDNIQEGIDAAAFFGEISLLGQLKTPTLCYSLEPDFDKSGSTLTLRVDAKSTNSPNCTQAPGGFQYTAVLRHLNRGTYTLRVIHSVPGAAAQEYTQSSLTIR